MPKHKVHRTWPFVKKQAIATDYVRIWNKDRGWLVTADVTMPDGTKASVEGKGPDLVTALKSFWRDYYSFAPRTIYLKLPDFHS